MALGELNRGEWAEFRGGCVVDRRPLLAETQLGDFPSGRSHVQLRRKTLSHTHTLTHADLHTCQGAGGSGNNKANLIMLVPADTSHANAYA